MAGIYIHIPFCKQACHYCNFHFSTSLIYKESVVKAIAKELFLRKEELKNQSIETLYLGGGTPSLLHEAEMEMILQALNQNYDLGSVKEFTLEANPDDMDDAFFKRLRNTPVNRLSIGVQSFFEADLKMMNRAHNAREAKESIQRAKDYGYHNLSIDLIYGVPGMSNENWRKNIEIAIAFDISHLSSYCLTLEPKTVFGIRNKKAQFSLPADEVSEAQFMDLIHITREAGFDQYEISNFGKPEFYALHNTNYWKGIPYLGIGPGAHSFFPGTRMWNVSNNQQYLRSLEKNELPYEKEVLGLNDQFNEYVMTGLRTKWGISLKEIEEKFGSSFAHSVQKDLQIYIENGAVYHKDAHLILSESGKFLADGIASAAFIT